MLCISYNIKIKGSILDRATICLVASNGNRDYDREVGSLSIDSGKVKFYREIPCNYISRIGSAVDSFMKGVKRC